MSKLLSAGFARLWKSKLFYLELIVAAVVAATAGVTQYREAMLWDAQFTLEQCVFNIIPFILFFSASFVALFTGSEYSDGTIRNKLIVGHTRRDVYLSEFIVNSAATLIICLCQLLIAFFIALPMCGFFKAPVTHILLLLLSAALMIIALAALFTMLAMLISSKSANAVLCMSLVCLMFFAGLYLQSRLNEPEISQGYYLVDGELKLSEPELNPLYISGVKRQVYQFLFDFLPMGQAIHVADYTFAWYYPLYSLILIGITTVPGLLLFRRKDIK